MADDEDTIQGGMDDIAVDPSASETMTGFISSPDCHPASKLLDTDRNNIKIGEDNTVLLGFKNTGDSKFLVKYIRGYLTQHTDFRQQLQNFTGFLYNSTIESKESTSFVYKFSPKTVDSGSYGVVVDVYYINEDNQTLATTFYNETCTLTEVGEGLNFQSLLSSLTMIFVVAGIAYMLGTAFGGKKTRQSTKSKSEKQKSAKKYNEEESKKEVNEKLVPAHVRKFMK